MSCRRAALRDVTVQPTTHAGLWLDRYLKYQTGDPHNEVSEENVKASKSQLIQESAGRGTPSGYKDAFSRWQALLADDDTVTLRRAKGLGRTVVGLGDKGTAEVGIHLSHTWGVPVLPGSALKGLAAAAAHKLAAAESWRKGGCSHQEMFGSVDEQGLVHFLDALWIPDASAPLSHDVMTSHHQEYYTQGNAPPSDMDSPNPIAFLSSGGSFLIAVQAADASWRAAALELLALGLEELGIGAKTNAGYGRMQLEELKAAQRHAPRKPARPKSDEDVDRAALERALHHSRHAALLQQWMEEGGPRETHRKALAKAMYKPTKKFKSKRADLVKWMKS